MIWLNLIIFSAIIFGTSIVLRKILNKNMPPDDILFFLFFGIILASILLIFILKKNKSFEEKFKEYDMYKIIIAVIAGFLTPFGTYLITNSYLISKNLAYTQITYTVFNTILLLLFSYFLFNSYCNKMTILGIFFALIGVSLIIKYQ
tara:strand:- start:9800 stop:10240 length:441 start_codon:yes stop_codon:yes gene_type:complete